ncbi:putative phosphopantetheine binding ACP domain-containing protein [Lupinus albus]|uniref:Acyl carrier protein n=1 Tax=Lupinus albus TaxID=3870 RepID=A0A6A4QTH7_LUPAL|nr:putative phosphopantetheine binding ACP domain-containing protein [Lupinus albus]
MAARKCGLPLMQYLRVQVDSLPNKNRLPFTISPINVFLRRFSEEVRGTFLDKSEVADRVITCVKNFQKVDPSKVNPNAHFQNDLGLDSLDATRSTPLNSLSTSLHLIHKRSRDIYEASF